MTPDEMRAAREELGATPDRMAAELGVAPHVYAAFEAGALRIPDRHARLAAYHSALAKRRAVLAASGLPECVWMERWVRQPAPQSMRAWNAHVALARTHLAGCGLCTARNDYARVHAPPIPELPLPGWMRAVRAGAARLDRLPSWGRPVAVGATVAGAALLIMQCTR